MVEARIVIVTGLIVLSVSACRSSQEAATPPDSPPPEPQPTPAAFEQFVTEAVEGTSWSARDVRRRLGPPMRVDAEPTVNRHDTTQTDTLRTLVYDGLAVQFYDVARSGRQLLSHLTLTSDRYETPGGLRVGLRRDSIRRVLGEPMRREDGADVYRAGSEPTPTVLTVTFAGGTATRFAWSFYVD